jgi:hypothetical protein
MDIVCDVNTLFVPADILHSLLDSAAPSLLYTTQRPFKSNPERLKKVAPMTVKIVRCWPITENLPG